MASSCFQVPPTVVPSTFTLRSSSSFEMNSKIGRRRNVINKRLNYRCCCSSSNNIPSPPLASNEPLKQKQLDAVDDEKDPPFLDLLMPFVGYGGYGIGGGRGGRGRAQYEVIRAAQKYQRRYQKGRRLYGPRGCKTPYPPPDLASMYLEERIIYLGLPLVELVSELIFAEFLYLQYTDELAPIYLYIDCPGTTGYNDQLVAHPAEAMAIYDTMMLIPNEVETVCFGDVTGFACLLLAAGKLGRRFMTPFGRIKMIAPPIEGSGLKTASSVARHAKEASIYTQLLFKHFAFHTGHRLDDIKEKLKHPMYMNAQEALDFGVVDKLLLQPGTTPEFYGLNLKPGQWHKTTKKKPEEREEW